MIITLKIFKRIVFAVFIFLGLASFASNLINPIPTINPTRATPKSDKATPDSSGELFRNVLLSPEPDVALVEQGRELIKRECITFHQFERNDRKIPIVRINDSRNSILKSNIINNLDEFLKEGPIDETLLNEHMAHMINLNLKEEETRAIFEYCKAYNLVEFEDPKIQLAKLKF